MYLMYVFDTHITPGILVDQQVIPPNGEITNLFAAGPPGSSLSHPTLSPLFPVHSRLYIVISTLPIAMALHGMAEAWPVRRTQPGRTDSTYYFATGQETKLA